MRYTTLRVVDQGVVLGELHLRRLLGEGEWVRSPFLRFARSAPPGVYTLRAAACRLQVTNRIESRLRDGMPARFVPSPYAGGRGARRALHGAFPKPAPPNAYDALRRPGVATVLTSADGRELYEGCSAALLVWDGDRLLLVPEDRPRVASLAEIALVEAARRPGGVPVQRQPLRVEDDRPLLLVNAVKGPCVVSVPNRRAFPAEVRGELERLLLKERIWRG